MATTITTEIVDDARFCVTKAFDASTSFKTVRHTVTTRRRQRAMSDVIGHHHRRRRRLHDAAAALLAVLALESRLGSILLEEAQLLSVDSAAPLPAATRSQSCD